MTSVAYKFLNFQLPFLLFLVLLSFEVNAQCKLRLRDVTGKVDIHSNNQSVLFAVRNIAKSNVPCPFFVTFSKGKSQSYNRLLSSPQSFQDVSYNLYKESQGSTVLKELPEAQSNEVITGAVPANQQTDYQLNYFFRFQQQLYPAGRYSDRVTLRLYSGDFSNVNNPESSLSTLYSYVVAKKVQLSLVDTNAPFDHKDTRQNLDFGILQTGESLNFDVVVKTNVAYVLQFSSQNRGRLKNVSVDSFIDYNMQLSGNPVSLTSSTNQTSAVHSMTNINRHPVQITIGPVSGKKMGQYTDNVTITVATVE